jgi:hypothetical protein
MRSVRHLALVSLLVACERSARGPTTDGQLEVSWTGKDRGGVSGAATATWCPARRVLEIQSIAGDTGVAVAVYPERSLVSGTYQVLEPARAESLPPAAGVAVRWLGRSMVQGFRGDSGSVVLERSGAGLLSGRLGGRARSVVDTQHIRLRGTFRNLAIRSDSLACQTPENQAGPNPDPEDTSVH